MQALVASIMLLFFSSDKQQGRGTIMGIFTRFRDIISSNINAMLDKAENPEKLIKLIIREMEDTLIELKAACAGVIVSRKKIQRQVNQADERAAQWQTRATLALSKGRDDLAREALLEKRHATQRSASLTNDREEHDALIGQYQDDIRLLQEKLDAARDKQRMLIQRHARASNKLRAQDEIRRLESTDTLLRFEELENRIERMEVEADMGCFVRKSNLESEFEALCVDEELERELADLKKTVEKKPV
jgi:phage shock protein A